MANLKPMLVGESNPYGGDDRFALYPAPDGCSGHRLACLILGMHRAHYLEAFDRVNLVRGKWSVTKARAMAESLWNRPTGQVPKFILLGAKVSAAFQTPFVPFEISEGGTILVLPHPSGLCRLWNEPDAFALARAAVATFAPEVSPLLGDAADPHLVSGLQKIDRIMHQVTHDPDCPCGDGEPVPESER